MGIDGILIAITATGIVVALYAYIGFPIIAAFLGALRSKARGVEDRRREPRHVTVIISAYNEEESLEAKILNVLDSRCPLLDVLVVSDGSTDRTNEIAKSFRPRGVRLLAQSTRSGKSTGLNQAMDLVRGQIIVFTDANASFDPQTIPKLVSYF